MTNQHDRSYGERREPHQGFERTTGSYQDDDPLAELARLVGQKDPFETFYRSDDRPRRGAAPAGSDDHRTPAGAEDRLPYDAERAEAAPDDMVPLGFLRGGYAAEAREAEPPVHDDPIHAQPAAASALDPSWHNEARAAVDSRAAEWEDGPSYRRPPKAEEALVVDTPAPALERSERPRREVRAVESGRRKAFAIAAALVGVAVLGGGAAVAYRAIGGAGTNGEPPLIKAEPGPAKVAVSDAAGEPAAPGPAAPDGGVVRSEPERLVPREEKVAALPQGAGKPPTRVALPNPTDANGSGADLEPRKVRTLVVKPDGTVVKDEPGASVGSVTIPAPPAAPPTAVQQPAAPVEPARQPVASDAPAPETASPAPSVRSRVAALRQQAPAAPSSEPEKKAAGAGSSSPWAVQLTSQKSQAQALAAYAEMQKKHRSVLGDKQPQVVKADLGDKGTVYRVRVGAESQDAANKLCSSLKSAGAGCFVQRN